MRPLYFIAAAALVAGDCEYRPNPIPVAGDTSAIQSLTGKWAGGYRSIESRRSGTILFDLDARGDSATGRVMIDDSSNAQLRAADDPSRHRAHASSPQMLFIRFVQVK